MTGQIKTWKAAIADRNRQQRRDRSKRPGPQITGIRIPRPADSPVQPGPGQDDPGPRAA